MGKIDLIWTRDYSGESIRSCLLALYHGLHQGRMVTPEIDCADISALVLGWQSLGILPKQCETPASHNASKNASDVVYDDDFSLWATFSYTNSGSQ